MAEQIDLPKTDNSFTMLRAMVGIGIVCGFLIVFTYENTLPRIERLKNEALQEAIFKVIPGVTTIQEFSYVNKGFIPVEDADKQVIYAGYDDSGSFKGVAIEASGQGYAGTIKILYGYDPSIQKVVGFHVLESKETPGLGDKIEKDKSFLKNFTALDVSLNQDKSTLEHKVKTVKKGAKENEWEIDGITGATISSRAIGEIVNKSASEWAPLIFKNKDTFILKD